MSRITWLPCHQDSARAPQPGTSDFPWTVPSLPRAFRNPIHQDLAILVGCFFFFFKILLIFRERVREGEKHQCVVASPVPPTGDLAHNPGRLALNPLSHTSQGIDILNYMYFQKEPTICLIFNACSFFCMDSP